MTTLSLIVPVHTDPVLARRAVVSIAEQTRRPEQLVLVDDSGGDGAFEAACAAATAAGLPVTTARHERNRGVSAARNTGLRHACGDVVGFVDADDELDPGFAAELLGLMRRHDAEIAVSRTRLVGDAEGIVEAGAVAPVVTGEDYARLLLEDREKGYVTNKLFRRAALGDAPFPEGRVYEDFPVVLRAALRSRRVAVSRRALYRYRVDAATVSQRFGPHLDDLFVQLGEVIELVQDRPALGGAARAYRLALVALPAANMALRAEHERGPDPLTRSLVRRARETVRIGDTARLALGGRMRLALRAAILKSAPRSYSRMLRAR